MTAPTSKPPVSKPPKTPSPPFRAWAPLVVFILFSLVWKFYSDQSSKTNEIPYSELVGQAKSGNVKSLELSGLSAK
ncbi:MAG: ATP-dependent metallopeptidase FtsH/Yme1/Tma family protein, partial [Polyangiaceae bacterium]|nr:ATP-dependent metallopeptidase FtsH/Yme1/Tma family protein [Polyangiaceae bacterium]